MSDRDLMLEILGHVREQNGAVAEVMTDYYGSEERKIKGTKPQVDENTKDIATGKTVSKTLMAVVGVIGVGNIIAVLSLLGG